MEAAQWREIQKFVPERPFAGHLASPMEGGGRDVSVSYFVGWQEWQDSNLQPPVLETGDPPFSNDNVPQHLSRRTPRKCLHHAGFVDTLRNRR
jgi:hypothetical protein